MFTGIVEETGTIRAIRRRGEFWRIEIAADTVCQGTAIGDSIAVDGVCLTAVSVAPDGFAADISPETRMRSTLERLGPGAIVNLERAVTPSTRLGGHLVQGHVDARGTIVGLERQGDASTLTVRFPHAGRKYLVEKGAVAVDGVSLTVAGLSGDTFSVAVIPHTFTRTTLPGKKPGDEMNLEYDVVAKYVESLLIFGKNDTETMTVDFLKNRGFGG
jgi:riboflavin synthase